MKKIGILTHYYDSKNYGGNLQAYALVRVIESIKNDFTVEQISCDSYSVNNNNQIKSFVRLPLFEKIKMIRIIFIQTCQKMKNRIFTKKIDSIDLNKRFKAFEFFNHTIIKHSDELYNISNFSELGKKYDIIIVGSDQVWNIGNVENIFLLRNVDTFKISYAASISQKSLSKIQKKIFSENLSSFKAVSVREENAVELLKDLSPVTVECHLDPTLLLTREDWDGICSERIVAYEYIFCYFLGGDNNQRKIVKRYAKKNDLKIVTLPYLLNYYRKCDDGFADLSLFNVSPQDLISLIKYAKIVFTDSFHVAAFSGVYQKQYIVFDRQGHQEMGSRIHTLMSLYETPERFCDTGEKETLEYIESLKFINYGKELVNLKKKREESILYLKKNLNVY